MLPAKAARALAQITPAVVNVPVANRFSGPSAKLDVVSQAIYGSNVDVLKQQPGWVEIRTPADDYTGWVQRADLVAAVRAKAPGDRLDLTVVNPLVDPTWRFMTLDWDGKIRMDCSSPNAMASLIHRKDEYQIATGNDADADRHGIVTPDAGLMNPNHYLAVAIHYLLAHRLLWSKDAAVGKTLVSSSLIDRVVERAERKLFEVPVGFKWFAPGLLEGSLCFGGEESAGASLLQRDAAPWTTDKDGILLALLASEILARTGKSPSEHYHSLVERHGEPAYARIDAAATREEKARLGALTPDAVTADFCPFQKGNLCTAREPRPLGCRRAPCRSRGWRPVPRPTASCRRRRPTRRCRRGKESKHAWRFPVRRWSRSP